MVRKSKTATSAVSPVKGFDYQSLAKSMGKVDGAAVQLSSDKLLCDPAGYIPTRSTLLDLLLGGGVPIGTILNIIGCEGTGKSTCIVSILAQAQSGVIIPAKYAENQDYTHHNFAVAYGDCEMRMSKERAKDIGLLAEGASQYIYIAAEHLEGMFESVHKFIDEVAKRSNPDDPVWALYAVDTLDLATKAKCEGKGEGVGGRAAVMWDQFRMLSYPLALNNATMLVSSPLQEVIDFGSKYDVKWRKAPWTTSGGAAPRYRGANLLLREGALYYAGSNKTAPEGYWMKAKLAKSHYARPNREVLIPVSYNYGYDEVRSLVTYLLGNDSEKKQPRESVSAEGEVINPVKASGAWYEFDDGITKVKAQGAENFIEAVREANIASTLSWYVRAAWGIENREHVWLPGKGREFLPV